MAKLRKEPSAMEKDKKKVVTGKVTKVKKITEAPQMRDIQIKLHSTPQAKPKSTNKLTSATPFSTNSTLKFTSTPMNVENVNSNRKLSLKKLPPRLPLSPIFSNACQAGPKVDNTQQKSNDKNGNVVKPKENIPERDTKRSKENNENVSPDIRISTRRQAVRVQSDIPASENAITLVNKENTGSRRSRERVRLPKMCSSVESLSSDSQSSKQSNAKNLQKHAKNQKNESFKSYTFTDSSVSPDSKSKHRHDTKKTSPNTANNHYLVKRLQSDWSSATFGEENPTHSDVRKRRMTEKRGVNQKITKKQKNNSFKSHSSSDSSVSPDSKTRHGTKKTSSNTDNFLVKRLQSDWSSTTHGEDIPTPSGVRKTRMTSKTTEINGAKQKHGQKQKNDSFKSYTFSDSSVSPDSRTRQRHDTKKTSPNTDHYLMKRLQSDWSSTTYEGEIPTPSDVRKTRMASKTTETNGVKHKDAKNQNNESLKSYTFSDSSVSPDTRTGHSHNTKKTPPSPVKNNTTAKRLRSDRSSTTFGKEITTTSVHTTSKSAKINGPNQQYRQNNCSNLRVRLRRNTNDCNSPPIDMPPKRRKSCYDGSVMKHIESDCTAETFKQTPGLNGTPKDKQIQRQQVNKRRLTPLVEMSVEDTTIPTDTPTTTPKVAPTTRSNNNEDEYSSSAEFQSDDEVSLQSRSKRAPTWKDLLNKTTKSPEASKNSLPVVKLKKSPSKKSVIDPDPNLSPVEESQQKEQHKAVGDNCQKKTVVVEIKKVSGLNKESKPPNRKNKEDNVVGVSNDVPLKEIHEKEIQNQNLGPDISARQETIGLTSPRHNNSQIPDSISRFDETDKSDIIDLRQPVKFFHSRSENTVSVAKPTQSLKRLRSSRRKKQESIYEFLSQSSSESNNPVDDVIQKMIKSGKVVVAKHKKGTGMNTLSGKRIRKKKTTKPEEIPRNPKPKKPVAAKKPPVQEKMNVHFDDGQNEVPPKRKQPLAATKPPVQEKIQDDFDNGLHFDDDFHFDDGENEIPEEEEEQVRDKRGFSNLARSAMIKQAGRIQKPLQRKPITDKKKLLAMAMKFVNQSTPVRNSPQALSGPQFSPMPGSKSPWRVDDDKLPNLFYLGRNSDNLPSFSSDYIPMTPTKNKSKSLSSFSSNDSNGENTAPPGVKVLTNDANMEALTNTRKALSYRSPLKAINILEVVNLPPLALHSYGKNSNVENASNNDSKETNRNSTQKNASNIFDSISNNNNNFRWEANNSNHKSYHNSHRNSKNNSSHNSNHSKSDISNENAENQLENTKYQNIRKSTSDVSNENDNLTNLFGFEELIDDENSSTNIAIDKTILPNKEALKERLQRLKQLRPNKPVVMENKNNRIEPVFDNARPKQKTLKQMLCSTMIDNNQHHHGEEHHSFNDTEDLSNLFKDLEPETTFDESLPRRTYNRPFKRKRKALSNLAIMMESDESEDEEEARPVKNYKAKPRKRQKKDPQLNKFVNDFNEMCKEVSQYELIVE